MTAKTDVNAPLRHHQWLERSHRRQKLPINMTRSYFWIGLPFLTDLQATWNVSTLIEVIKELTFFKTREFNNYSSPVCSPGDSDTHITGGDHLWSSEVLKENPEKYRFFCWKVVPVSKFVLVKHPKIYQNYSDSVHFRFKHSKPRLLKDGLKT